MIGVRLIGAIVLAGFPALPWGQLGAGPTPPSLGVLINQLMVPPELLEEVIDKLFRLHAAAPAQLRRDGELRPAVGIAFASLVMYYEERKAAGEMRSVQIEMEVAVRNVYAARGQEVDACVLIPQWGKYIKSKFDLDNLRLTHQHSETANTQVRPFRPGWTLRVVPVVVFSEHNALRVCYSNFGFKLNASNVYPVLRCLNALFIHSVCCVVCSLSPLFNAWRSK